MKKPKPINLIAFSIIACAILSLVGIGIGIAYIWGWPFGLTAACLLVWIELNLFGVARERTGSGISQSGKSADFLQ